MDTIAKTDTDAYLSSILEAQIASLLPERPRPGITPFGAAGQGAAERLSAFQRQMQAVSPEKLYQATSHMALNRLVPAMAETERWLAQQKQAADIAMEWLMGPPLDTALQAAQLFKPLQRVLGNDVFKRMLREANDLALGNGGLGRLMACYIDAFANQHLPVKGYGLWFEKGFFQQDIVDNRQVDREDPWLAKECPWFIRHDTVPDVYGEPITVEFGGHVVERHRSPSEKFPYGYVDHIWGIETGATSVTVAAHILPVPSQDGRTVLPLCLWKVNEDSIDRQHPFAEYLFKINEKLYPGETDNPLRLFQEHVLVSASLQDVHARHERRFGARQLGNFSQWNAVQINDTHPALAVMENIRLIQRRGADWDKAINETVKSGFYANHTLAPEALEKWKTGVMQGILPRHAGIAMGLGDRFKREISVKVAHGDIPEDRRHRIESATSIVEFDPQGRDGPNGTIHMARAAAAYTTRTIGVSDLHGRLLRESLFPELIEMGRDVGHITNGISQRRWMQQANRPLSEVFDGLVGPGWVTNLSIVGEALKGRENDIHLLQQISHAKTMNKRPLIEYIGEKTGIEIGADALIDAQIKRFHEYKRQFLNLVDTVAQYLDILANPNELRPKVAKVFAGKAAPTYERAKDCIGLVHHLADIINNDPQIGDKLKLVFLKDYGVSTAQFIVPATDLSEQISTAGMEASGTSNMKMALNGALTIGTRDGANIEIGARAGENNFFFFGIDERRVAELRKLPTHEYRQQFVEGEANARLRGALEFISQNMRSNPATLRYAYMAETILNGDDHWMVAADFNDYRDTQKRAHRLFLNPQEWARQALINIGAGSGFSADDSAHKYARQWEIRPRDFGAGTEVAREPTRAQPRGARIDLVH